jgi:hypothetical protein
MEQDQLADFYSRLSVLVDSGDENGAQAFIKEEFPKLSEDTQGELLARIYFSAVEDLTQEEEAILEVQKQGLAAVEVLEELKEKSEGTY